MEKHECKLCFKSFSNGRALGGHMRSHMKKLPLPAKPEASSPPHTLLSFEAESASSSSSSSSSDDDDGDDDDEEKGLSYGLRENPKKSIRLADPEFSFLVDATNNNGSVILQDRESETESSKDPTRSRRRSKRAWKLGGFHDQYNHHHQYHHHRKLILEEAEMKRKLKSKNKISKTESEPASSISDATTEEDVAFCLMMLSRDKWKRQKDLERRYDVVEDEDEEEEEEEDDDDEEEEEEEEEEEAERSLDDTDESEENLKSSKTRARGRYTCETCKKVFRSYQALGGHRASHKKIKVAMAMANEAELTEMDNNGGGGASSSMAVVHDNNYKKVHECPFCFRVFSSGQALGGHKRTHLTGSSSATSIRASTKFVENMIDLNLPAPMEEDEILIVIQFFWIIML
ncbi:zinc finger protein ZAT9-like [Senna tora]|uniref:Zinc finger protein ZAT9-like n=1 Tax=Senna tora TaxID=362788 RepID=A0A834WJK3_9FABA|nr:zinc finger protein ZAT9-like [Senna tora]